MVWVKGKSGNPLGSKGFSNTKRQWITESRKIREARKTFDNLCNLRDSMILERREIEPGKYIEVVPSIRDFIACNALILDRTLGKPLTQIEVKDSDGKPLAWNLVLQQPKDVTDAQIVETKQLEPPQSFTISYKEEKDRDEPTSDDKIGNDDSGK